MADLLLAVCTLLAVVSAALALGVGRALSSARRLPACCESPPEDATVSVVVPARNEEADLAHAVRSILAQQSVAVEVIVVNDGSTDRTGEVADSLAAGDPRVRVIHNPPLAPGWLGKQNAMQHGAAAVRYDHLLFTDADVVHEPSCFVATRREMRRCERDFISLFPRIVCRSFWENVLMPMYAGGLLIFVRRGIEDPESPAAVAAGALMLVKREVFTSIGGVEPIRGEGLDDLELARLVKGRGYRVGFRFAPELLKVRLFKGNRDAFWGTTKNVLGAVKGRLWLALPLMFLPVLLMWTPLAVIAAGIAAGKPLPVIAGTATYCIQYATLLLTRPVFDFHRGKALWFPLVALPVFCCVARALYYHLFRRAIAWRGRVVETT